MRTKGTEILMTFLQGLYAVRNSKQGLSKTESEVLVKFLSYAVPLCQDNQWSLRKICAENLEKLGILFTQEEISTVFVKEVSVS